MTSTSRHAGHKYVTLIPRTCCRLYNAVFVCNICSCFLPVPPRIPRYESCGGLCSRRHGLRRRRAMESLASFRECNGSTNDALLGACCRDKRRTSTRMNLTTMQGIDEEKAWYWRKRRWGSVFDNKMCISRSHLSSFSASRHRLA